MLPFPFPSILVSLFINKQRIIQKFSVGGRHKENSVALLQYEGNTAASKEAWRSDDTMAVDEILQRDIERNGPVVNYGQDGGRGSIWRGIFRVRERREGHDEEEREERVQVKEEKETENESVRAE